MKKSKPISFLFCILFLITLGINSWATESETQFVRAYFDDKQAAYRMFDLFEVEGREVNYEEGYNVLEVTSEQIADLVDLGYRVYPDPDYDVYHGRTDSKGQDGTIPGYPSYKIVEKTFSMADSITKAHPDLATWLDVGDSWNKINNNKGYDIHVLRLTNAKIPGSKPKLFISGSIHAREYTTSELLLRFVLQMLGNYGKTADATWALDHHELHAMFYMNPDGRKHAEGGKLWRKNCNENYCKRDQSKRGADLNRNFDANWSGGGDQCGQTWPGTSGGSEPEVKCTQDYMLEIFKDYEKGIYIDLHSYGEVIYAPGASPVRQMVNKMRFFNNYGKYEKRAGMTYEYGWSKVKVVSMLFELGTTFFQPCNYFENKILPANLPAFEYCIRACSDAYNIAFGPDAVDVKIANNKLTATIDGTRLKGTSTQNVAAAEYYIDKPPWVTGAKANPMTASDGNFNAKTEKVEASISLDDYRDKKVIVYVRGKSSDDKWGVFSSTFSDMTNITTPAVTNAGTKLSMAFPNPYVPSSTITLNIPQTSHLKMTIYNASGKAIVTLVNKRLTAGNHTIQWDGTDSNGKKLTHGMFLYRLQSDYNHQSGKFFLAE